MGIYKRKNSSEKLENTLLSKKKLESRKKEYFRQRKKNMNLEKDGKHHLDQEKKEETTIWAMLSTNNKESLKIF